MCCWRLVRSRVRNSVCTKFSPVRCLWVAKIRSTHSLRCQTLLSMVQAAQFRFLDNYTTDHHLAFDWTLFPES